LINRLKPYMEEPEEEPPANDYFEIVAHSDTYYVERDEAERVARLLQRRWPPRWIQVTDIFGGVQRLRRNTITAICESTDGQRARARSFRRARRSEEKQDRRPWEDDDW
jgi:hypothetical protein